MKPPPADELRVVRTSDTMAYQSITSLTYKSYVYTIVVTMNKYISTVIKTGNSYALRVPKQYIDDAKLELGQKASIQLPILEVKQDRERIQVLFKQLQELGAFKGINDPSAWQREIRKDRPLPGRD
jgi:antitoxin component of MazEF toxin-antitoxin module